MVPDIVNRGTVIACHGRLLKYNKLTLETVEEKIIDATDTAETQQTQQSFGDLPPDNGLSVSELIPPSLHQLLIPGCFGNRRQFRHC